MLILYSLIGISDKKYTKQLSLDNLMSTVSVFNLQMEKDLLIVRRE